MRVGGGGWNVDVNLDPLGHSYGHTPHITSDSRGSASGVGGGDPAPHLTRPSGGRGRGHRLALQNRAAARTYCSRSLKQRTIVNLDISPSRRVVPEQGVTEWQVLWSWEAIGRAAGGGGGPNVVSAMVAEAAAEGHSAVISEEPNATQSLLKSAAEAEEALAHEQAAMQAAMQAAAAQAAVDMQAAMMAAEVSQNDVAGAMASAAASGLTNSKSAPVLGQQREHTPPAKRAQLEGGSPVSVIPSQAVKEGVRSRASHQIKGSASAQSLRVKRRAPSFGFGKASREQVCVHISASLEAMLRGGSCG